MRYLYPASRKADTLIDTYAAIDGEWYREEMG